MLDARRIAARRSALTSQRAIAGIGIGLDGAFEFRQVVAGRSPLRSGLKRYQAAGA